MIKRITILLYAVVCYLVFFGTFLYAIGFIGNFLVPTTLDGAPRSPLVPALVVDLALLSLFALQHSVMARPFFKRWITRAIPRAAERSTYVLFSSLALILLFVFWQPLGGTVWQAESAWARNALYGLYGLGWVVVLVATFLIDHFDLFGLRQAWFAFRGESYQPPRFVTPAPYRVVRHPLYIGWLIVFWSTPTMTLSHLLFAIVTTLYILVAIRFEERDLMSMHPEYEQYRLDVPMLIPRWSAKKARSKPSTSIAG